jgi:four helix bundle protein
MKEERREGERKPTKSYRELLVWQRAHEFVLGIYRFSGAFPDHEMFGLTSQIRRAAVSVPSNIAEGYKRRGKRDKARFLNMAQASLEEASYQLILASDLGYGETDQLWEQYEEVSRLLNRYESSIRLRLAAWLPPLFSLLPFFHSSSK